MDQDVLVLPERMDDALGGDLEQFVEAVCVQVAAEAVGLDTGACCLQCRFRCQLQCWLGC